MNLGFGIVHGHPTPTQSHPQLAAAAAAASFPYGGGAATSGGCAGGAALRWPSSAPAAGPIRAAASGGWPTTAAAAGAAEGSFYELLGIPESGTLQQIKRAYKQMALRYHPDVSPPDREAEYTRRFIAVQEAYETLSDPARRAVYDRDLAGGLHLAFSSRRRLDEELKSKTSWKSHWQDQLSQLKRRNMQKDTGENLSWGAQMRRKMDESSA